MGSPRSRLHPTAFGMGAQEAGVIPQASVPARRAVALDRTDVTLVREDIMRSDALLNRLVVEKSERLGVTVRR